MADEIVSVSSPIIAKVKDALTHPVSIFLYGAAALLGVFIVTGVYRGYFKKPEPTQHIEKAQNVITDDRKMQWVFGCAQMPPIKVDK